MFKIASKTVSWLIVSGLLIFLSAGFATGNWTAAFWAAFWACLLKTPVYAAHETVFERAWTGIFGKTHVPHVGICAKCEEFLDQEAA